MCGVKWGREMIWDVKKWLIHILKMYRLKLVSSWASFPCLIQIGGRISLELYVPPAAGASWPCGCP